MKTSVITGASRGIGKALAERFLENGDFVIGSSRSGAADFGHANLFMLPLEQTGEGSVKAFVDQVGTLHKPIDIFINNAGTWDDGDEGPEIDIGVLRRTLEANLFGPIALTEALSPLMAAGSHIINVSSRRGSMSFNEISPDQPQDRATRHPAYSISKAGLNMFTRKLAVRLLGKTIVSSVHPGSVKTDMNPEGKISAEESAEDIFKLAYSRPETGQFWFKGEKFPW